MSMYSTDSVPRFTYRNTHGNPSSLSNTALCSLVIFFFALPNNISDEHQCSTCFSLIANNNLPTRVSKCSCFDHGLCGLRERFKLTSKFANSVAVSFTINRPRSGTFSGLSYIADVNRKEGVRILCIVCVCYRQYKLVIITSTRLFYRMYKF